MDLSLGITRGRIVTVEEGHREPAGDTPPETPGTCVSVRETILAAEGIHDSPATKPESAGLRAMYPRPKPSRRWICACETSSLRLPNSTPDS
ncbi:hypothetical protein D9V34_10460 [Mycetocola lacteus]|uniref:Uncharacterized protein n=1 Tax=Mycetocola lacteus TaxID=76637 RepID=A0A3L7APF6_9MICO|nr:hypothetical protein D9V34_10460 [Mycetocola lacteus]